MKSSVLLVLLALVGFVAYVHAGCNDAAANKDSNEGSVTTFFKDLGCTIKKGAEDLSESAKPWADKIGSSAKEFGSSVAQKYDEIKHKLTDDNSAHVAGAASTAHLENVPTEKVPLAPLSDDAAKAAAAA